MKNVDIVYVFNCQITYNEKYFTTSREIFKKVKPFLLCPFQTQLLSLSFSNLDNL